MDQRGGGEGPAPGPRVWSNERVIVSSFLVIKLIWMEGEGGQAGNCVKTVQHHWQEQTSQGDPSPSSALLNSNCNVMMSLGNQPLFSSWEQPVQEIL